MTNREHSSKKAMKERERVGETKRLRRRETEEGKWRVHRRKQMKEDREGVRDKTDNDKTVKEKKQTKKEKDLEKNK